ncbi:unnamed protein product [Clonostachys solani]|uniref:BZIP domain-containing protein n=1 Tax=Clonostachys solani TaxID=160281 RepID=A0A9N9Z0X7_9HYPO|nr:unnamed protein product [Clonostachys solani]
MDANTALPEPEPLHMIRTLPCIDDWSGISDPGKRRKLQNRLNQRKYRERRKRNPDDTSPARSPTTYIPDPSLCHIPSSADRVMGTYSYTPGEASVAAVWAVGLGTKCCGGFVGHGRLGAGQVIPGNNCQLGSEESMLMIKQQTEVAWCEYVTGKIILRRLPTILSINVFHALARNAKDLGVEKSWMIYDSVSSFYSQGARMAVPAIPSATPPCAHNLYPTDLQRTVEHHPWIDLFPFPRMRDNILSAIASDGIDEDDLCYDLCDVDETGPLPKASLIIWGNAWDPRAWEVSEGFWRKWGWILDGCEEMMVTTNYWRQKRGERPILALQRAKRDVKSVGVVDDEQSL